MKIHLPIIPFLLSLFVINGYSQTALNGDFENNTAGSCLYNLSNTLFNTKMSNCFAFGSYGAIDIQNAACGNSNPASGSWFISLETNSSTLLTDQVSILLSAPLNVGQTYQISYFEKANSAYQTHTIDSLRIGISSDSLLFGTPIYSSLPESQTGWTEKTFSFVAPFSAKYITFTNQGAIYGWNFIDNIQISAMAGVTDTYLNSSVSVFPNPANKTFTVTFPSITRQIQIYNSAGQRIQTKFINGLENLDFEISDSGIYFIQIITDNGIVTKKVAIDKD